MTLLSKLSVTQFSKHKEVTHLNRIFLTNKFFNSSTNKNTSEANIFTHYNPHLYTRILTSQYHNII